MDNLIRSFKCPECGDEELTSAYFHPDGKFSFAVCFSCYAGLGTPVDIIKFNQDIERLWMNT